MQRILFTRSLLTEFARCDKSFVLSLFWHNLTNEVLEQKDTMLVNNDDIIDERMGLFYDTEQMRTHVDIAGGITLVQCDTNDIFEKVQKTLDFINCGEPVVISDGALEGGNLVVSFASLVVKPNGKWEVYHLSSKTQSLDSGKASNKALNDSLKDAAPLMYVLSAKYSDKVDRVAVIGANKTYLIPYPDPDTRMIHINPEEALFCIDLFKAVRMPNESQLENDIMDAISNYQYYYFKTHEIKKFEDGCLPYLVENLLNCIMEDDVYRIIEEEIDDWVELNPDCNFKFLKKYLADELIAKYRIDYVNHIEDYLGVDLDGKLTQIQNNISANPFWIPEVEMGSQCKNPYTCPYYSFCKSKKDQDSVFFYMPSIDAKHLEKSGCETMSDLLDLWVQYPDLKNIPINGENNSDGTFDVSEIGFRELRSYMSYSYQ